MLCCCCSWWWWCFLFWTMVFLFSKHWPWNGAFLTLQTYLTCFIFFFNFKVQYRKWYKQQAHTWLLKSHLMDSPNSKHTRILKSWFMNSLLTLIHWEIKNPIGLGIQAWQSHPTPSLFPYIWYMLVNKWDANTDWTKNRPGQWRSYT